MFTRRRLLNSRQVGTRNTLTHIEVRGCQQEGYTMIRRLFYVKYMDNLDRRPTESIFQQPLHFVAIARASRDDNCHGNNLEPI